MPAVVGRVRQPGLEPHPLGQAEIEDLHAPVGGQEDVLGLQVTVDDSFFVRGREAVRDLDPDLDGAALRERRALEARAQALSLQELHDGEGDALARYEIVYCQDIGVVQGGHRVGLAFEPGERVGVLRERFRQDLDRDEAVQFRIACFVHLSHAARAEGREDLVGAESRSRSQHVPPAQSPRTGPFARRGSEFHCVGRTGGDSIASDQPWSDSGQWSTTVIGAIFSFPSGERRRNF